MDPKKLMAMVNYPTPRNVMDVWAFLELTGYYQYSIQGYSQIT
jgi:hypothetical protein